MQNHEHACTLSTAPRPVAVAALYKCEDTYPSPWLLTTPYPNLTVSYTPILHKTLKSSGYHNGFKQKVKKNKCSHKARKTYTHTHTAMHTSFHHISLQAPASPDSSNPICCNNCHTGWRGECFSPFRELHSHHSNRALALSTCRALRIIFICFFAQHMPWRWYVVAQMCVCVSVCGCVCVWLEVFTRTCCFQISVQALGPPVVSIQPQRLFFLVNVALFYEQRWCFSLISHKHVHYFPQNN